MTTYLLAGGGTAGHVNPLLAIAERLRSRDPAAEILVLGTKEGLESRLVPARGLELLTIPRLPFPRRPSAAAIRFPFRFQQTVNAVRRILAERRVDLVFGVGGYAAAPAYVAAHRSGVPLAIHEANSIPGWANKLGARYTEQVGVAFRGTPLRHAVHVGLPLRREIEDLARPGRRMLARPEARAFFALEPDRPVLLVTGGSSGAKRVNETIVAALDEILAVGWQVLHASGGFRDAIAIERDGYHPVAYLDRMDLAFAAADLSLGRAGTGTVLETAALGIPAVFVPYAVGNGEQARNAREAVEAGGAILIEDAAFTPLAVRETLVPLLSDRARIAGMAAAMVSVGVPDGTDRTVALLDAALASGAR